MSHVEVRDDIRRSQLLKAHLEAGQWKTEAWCLADSLTWALGAISRRDIEGVSEEFEGDVAEHRLAADRLARVREALAG